MIHYHGLPMTPDIVPAIALAGGHAFVSFRHPGQLGIAAEVCQSFAVDNGAFSAWVAGEPVKDWRPYYEWVRGVQRMPGFDFAVIPDVIDGTEDENDILCHEWPHRDGTPVWHMHESLNRLVRLSYTYPRVAFGSSGDFAAVGGERWEQRMQAAMAAVCDGDGYPRVKLHGLRMLNPAVFSRYPLASADSTNIARNIGIDSAWRGTYTPPTKQARAVVMRQRIESVNGALRWEPTP